MPDFKPQKADDISTSECLKYFDYEQDGFGEVEYTADALIDRMIEYMENGCRLKECYRERIERTFRYSDQKNCQRVYEEIKKL